MFFLWGKRGERGVPRNREMEETGLDSRAWHTATHTCTVEYPIAYAGNEIL